MTAGFPRRDRFLCGADPVQSHSPANYAGDCEMRPWIA